MLTLVDSNVVLDLLTKDEEWLDWSSTMLARAANAGAVAINQIVYAEVSTRYTRVEDLDHALSPDYYVRVSLPWEAAFLAGKAFAQYRWRTGTKRKQPKPQSLRANSASEKRYLTIYLCC